jgi:hypothetical protein
MHRVTPKQKASKRCKERQMNRFQISKSTSKAAHRVLNGLQPAADTVQREVRDGIQSAGSLIGRNPIVSLSTAFVFGALVAYWIKRT